MRCYNPGIKSTPRGGYSSILYPLQLAHCPPLLLIKGLDWPWVTASTPWRACHKLSPHRCPSSRCGLRPTLIRRIWTHWWENVIIIPMFPNSLKVFLRVNDKYLICVIEIWKCTRETCSTSSLLRNESGTFKCYGCESFSQSLKYK